MDALPNLIDEAKVRAVWWGLCIFGISYFLSHTSKSMWTNVPLSFLILCGLRYLSYVAELRWRIRPVIKTSYLSHLQRRQISIKDPVLSAVPLMASWKQKINSPSVESAVREFVNKLMQDFVMDLWYSSITPDKDAPVLIRGLILDAIGEISARIKDINLVDLLTRYAVELISDHLEMFRRNQSAIGGAKKISTLSLEQIDEALKYYMLDRGELHPAIRSPECEYKVLQRLAGGVLTAVLEPREAQSQLVKCFSRELLTCLVLQPVMNLASPAYINELIEVIFLSSEDGNSNSNTQVDNTKTTSSCSETSSISNQSTFQKDLGNHSHVRTAEWARKLDAKTQRRTQVLASENIENMWTKGRNYKKKTDKLAKTATSPGTMKINSKIFDNYAHANADKEMTTNPRHNTMNLVDMDKTLSSEGCHFTYDQEGQKNLLTVRSKHHLRRSSSTSDINKKLGTVCLKSQENTDTTISGKSRETSDPRVGLEYPTFKQDEDSSILRRSPPLSPAEGYLHPPKLKCRVKGVSIENTGSSSFAVYSIDVTDAKKTWSVKRRYRNFERLHRNLKDIPNYNLNLPPKRILSSNLDDRFVNQRGILLEKYLQDLLSIANIAEKHEVWDFLSVSSKNYSHGKSTSVMKTIAVNVDDAVIDFVRQLKDGLRNKVVATPFSHAISPSEKENQISLVYPEDSISKSSLSDNIETPHSLSDDEGSVSITSISGWHSDNEVNSKGFPRRVVRSSARSRTLDYKRSNPSGKYENASNALAFSGPLEDQNDVLLEWSALNMPLLNLVDKLFQLKQRGWLRRQVLWISKQILQLMMGDTIDVYLMKPINLLRRDDFVAQLIRRVQDVLWPNGIFFTKLEDQRKEVDSQDAPKLSPCSSFRATDTASINFEQQLEATRRAKYVKKLILDGAPTALVNLIGQNQYRRSSKDIYHFLQSSICIKQLSYGILELLLVSIFPELHDLIEDIHLKSHSQSVK